MITPACLNRASELPRVEERDGKLAISLSSRCLCELFNHLRPDEAEDSYVRDREGYWGIDCNKHEYIYDDGDATKDLKLRMDRSFWGLKKWRKEMRKQWERGGNNDSEANLGRTSALDLSKQREILLPCTRIIRIFHVLCVWSDQLASVARFNVPNRGAISQDSLRNGTV